MDVNRGFLSRDITYKEKKTLNDEGYLMHAKEPSWKDLVDLLSWGKLPKA